MKKLFLLSFLFSIAYAQEAPDSLIESLQDDLQKYMKIAMQTKENVDYMPYVISTLHNQELVNLGVLSLREALLLLPGVDISIGMVGAQSTVFRGSNPFSHGQSKLLIDGVVVNNQMFGAYNQYLDMPIDVIERIEVVRGPGSLESGVNAYAGSINVITKANKDDGDKKENSLFAAYGSNEYKMGGFVGAYQNEDFELSSDLFYQEHDKTLPTGVDRYATPATDVPLWLKNYSMGINLRYKDFYIKSRFSNNEKGISYGQSFSTSQDKSDDLDVLNNSLEAGYGFKVANGVKAKLSIGYLYERRELQNKIMPDGAAFPKGRYMLADHSAQSFSERLEFKVSTLENHDVTAGVLLTHSSVLNNEIKISNDSMLTFQESQLLSNEKRDIYSFYVEDLIDFSEKTSFQLGLKFDYFSDVENQLNPRLAVVHRYDDENIFKLMYTHSYREPSWREQYLNGKAKPISNLDLEAESVDAYEAAYIRKFSKESDFKINLFYLVNKNQITSQNNASRYANMDDNELYGVEAEITTSLSPNDKAHLNYSYVAGNNSKNAFANVAQNMLKAYYVYNFSKGFTASSILKYIGEKSRVEGDSRENANAYVLADLTVNFKYEPGDVLVSFSIKNLFDQRYYLPAQKDTYEGDFEQEGRNFLVRLGKRF